jgi:tRNA pseudouridine55 synthase
VVQRVRRILGEKKIGHCGTLDPDATGLLLLTVGWATRLTRFLIRAPKVYEGDVRFGIATDTYDAAGTVVEERPTAGLTREAIAAAMAAFEGTLAHRAPPYSAKKVGGVKYYELARRGEEVPQETKEVTVFEFAPVGVLADDRLGFRLACSSGTYARTLAHELGRAVGTGAHLARLRRVKIGPFELGDAATLDELAAAVGRGEEPERAWVPFDRIALPFAEVVADAQQQQRIDHGQTVLVRDLAGDEGDWVKLVDRRQRFLAVGSVVERIGERGVAIVQPRIVFK